jgi:glutamate synthase (NADPH/NADH) small chain
MSGGKFEKVAAPTSNSTPIVLLAMGFVGPGGLLTDLGVELTDRGNVARGDDFLRPRCPASSWPATWAAGSP